jgi:ankyrin repeat protein
MTAPEKKLLDPAFLAKRENDLQAVKDYFAAGMPIHAVDAEGKNALFFAVVRDDAEMAAFLIESGLDINHKDKNGETALIKAVTYRRAEMVELLLSRGADIDAQNNDGFVALHHTSSLTIMNILLEAGANPDVQTNDTMSVGENSDYWGVTPLMGAAQVRDPEAVKALLAAGANPNLKSVRGTTALMFIATYKDQWSPKCEEILRDLVAAGADVNAQDKNGCTVLMDYARYMGWWSGRERALRILVEETEADISIKDNHGLTAIDYAKKSGMFKTVKYLTDYRREQELSAFKKGLPHPIKKPKPLRLKP